MKIARSRQMAFNPQCTAMCLAVLGVAGCSDSSEGLPIPIPDSFEAYFVAGAVCMPSNIATGTVESNGAPAYPIRFEICRHRCITLDRGTAHLRTSWQCAAGQCSMMMMASAEAHRVESETGCDGRELPSPPAGECTPETFTFAEMSPPCCVEGDAYVTGNMAVSVPFMDLDQAETVSERVEAGENPGVVIPEVVGPPPPDRVWTVNFDPSHDIVSDAEDLSGGDCHTIAEP